MSENEPGLTLGRERRKIRINIIKEGTDTMSSKKMDILVPIFTPFKENGEVDYDALAKLVRSVLDKGADGLYTGGSSAEFPLLTEEERRKTLEVAAKAGDGCPIIAHIGAPGTDLAISFGNHAKSVGVTALASVPPFYYGYKEPEIKSYYTDIADATGMQILVYSLSTMGTLSLEFYRDILADDRIFGLKYTQYNYYVLNRIRNSTDKMIYSGCDEAFASGLMGGAKGAIGTSMNFMVDVFVKIQSLFNAGDVKSVFAWQSKLSAIIEVTLRESVISSMKYAAKLLGVDCGAARLPHAPVSEAQKKAIEAVLKENL